MSGNLSASTGFRPDNGWALPGPVRTDIVTVNNGSPTGYLRETYAWCSFSRLCRFLANGTGSHRSATRGAHPPAGTRVKSGDTIAAANLITWVNPVYPPLA